MLVPMSLTEEEEEALLTTKTNSCTDQEIYEQYEPEDQFYDQDYDYFTFNQDPTNKAAKHSPYPIYKNMEIRSLKELTKKVPIAHNKKLYDSKGNQREQFIETGAPKKSDNKDRKELSICKIKHKTWSPRIQLSQEVINQNQKIKKIQRMKQLQKQEQKILKYRIEQYQRQYFGEDDPYNLTKKISKSLNHSQVSLDQYDNKLNRQMNFMITERITQGQRLNRKLDLMLSQGQKKINKVISVNNLQKYAEDNIKQKTKFTCFCGNEYESKARFNEHLSLKHPNDSQAFRIRSVNNPNNSFRTSLQGGRNVIHSTAHLNKNSNISNSEIFICRCQRECQNFRDLKIHVTKIHGDDRDQSHDILYYMIYPTADCAHYPTDQVQNPRYKCGCGKSYTSSSALNLHITNKHDRRSPQGTIGGYRKFSEHLTGYGSKSQVNSDDSQSKPPPIQRSFDNYNKLALKDSYNSFRCGCGLSYTCSSSLNYHIRKNHQGQVPLGTIGGYGTSILGNHVVKIEDSPIVRGVQKVKSQMRSTSGSAYFQINRVVDICYMSILYPDQTEIIIDSKKLNQIRLDSEARNKIKSPHEVKIEYQMKRDRFNRHDVRTLLKEGELFEIKQQDYKKLDLDEQIVEPETSSHQFSQSFEDGELFQEQKVQN